MSKQARASHPIYGLLPTKVKGFDALAELALDLSSSWDHTIDELWHRLEPELWELTQNPWAVLQTVSRQKLETVLAGLLSVRMSRPWCGLSAVPPGLPGGSSTTADQKS